MILSLFCASAFLSFLKTDVFCARSTKRWWSFPPKRLADAGFAYASLDRRTFKFYISLKSCPSCPTAGARSMLLGPVLEVNSSLRNFCNIHLQPSTECERERERHRERERENERMREYENMRDRERKRGREREREREREKRREPTPEAKQKRGL